jgi:hypothetical protein
LIFPIAAYGELQIYAGIANMEAENKAMLEGLDLKIADQ